MEQCRCHFPRSRESDSQNDSTLHRLTFAWQSFLEHALLGLYDYEGPTERMSIRAKIQQYADAILKLRSRWNIISPVSRLPNEILTEIFAIHEENCFEFESYSEVHYADGWMVFAHVCRHWREVALNCSTLWNYIGFGAPLDCVSEMFARSRKAHLLINVPPKGLQHLAWTAEKQQILDNILQNEISRVRTLILPLHIPVPKITTAKNLEELYLDGVDGNEDPGNFSDLIFGKGAPGLQNFELVRIHSFHWSPSMAHPNLTEFVLSCDSLPETTSMTDIITVLEGMPRLEYLDLGDLFPMIIHPRTPSSPMATLSHLETIKVDSEGLTNCANFLSYLNLPIVQTISVMGYLPHRGCTLPVAPISHLPNLSRASLICNNEDGIIMKGVRDIDGEQCPTILAFDWYRESAINISLHGSRFSKFIALSEIEDLTLDHKFSVASLISFLRQTTRLQHLHVQGFGALFPVLEALFLPDALLLNEADSLPRPSSFLSHLTHLHVKGADFPTGFYERRRLENLRERIVDAQDKNTSMLGRVKINEVVYEDCGPLTDITRMLMDHITGVPDPVLMKRVWKIADMVALGIDIEDTPYGLIHSDDNESEDKESEDNESEENE